MAQNFVDAVKRIVQPWGEQTQFVPCCYIYWTIATNTTSTSTHLHLILARDTLVLHQIPQKATSSMKISEVIYMASVKVDLLSG